MDRLRALNYLLKTAELKSFSAAAKHFGVSPSSISRRIQDLEADLGVALLYRSTRVVRLTELGTLYCDQVRPTIAALALADEMITEQSREPTGRLRITAMPGYGRARVLPTLEKLRREHPALVVDLELTDQVANLSVEKVDIAIRSTPRPPDRAVAKLLTENRYVLVAAPEYVKRRGKPQRLVELREHSALYYRGPRGIVPWQAKTNDEWREVDLPPALVSNVGEWLVREAQRGAGIALLPRWAIADSLADESLVEIQLSDAEVNISRSPHSGIYLLYHRPRYQLKKVRVAVDFILTELGEPSRDL